MSEEILVPRLGPTDRLVERPALKLVDAGTGEPPELATALRIGMRGEFLVARFDARHRGVVATLREENAALWTEDVVEAFVAFEDPPARYFEFEVNPLGARFSARIASPHGMRRDMVAETFSCPGFSAEARRGDGRWSATIRIPAARLAGAMPERFRANFFRIDRTAGEHSALFPTRTSPPDFHVAAAFGRFRVASGTGLER